MRILTGTLLVTALLLQSCVPSGNDPKTVIPTTVASDKLVDRATGQVKIADILFTNAKVYTVNQAQPWAETVAVRGNKIVYVGDAAGARVHIGENTETHDLAGRILLTVSRDIDSRASGKRDCLRTRSSINTANWRVRWS